jgi:D-galactarolactone isomerase
MDTLASRRAGTPFSAGTAPPATAVPRGACDCHVHVYDGAFAATPGARLTPPDAGAADYRLVQHRLGTERVVLVTPSTYGSDNRCMLAGLAQLAAAGVAARGVAVITGNEPDTELSRLAAAGVRGVRVNLSLGVTHTVADLAPLAQRIAPLGWHLQLLMPPHTLAGCADLLDSLPVQLVFDHFGRIDPAPAPAQAATTHAAHRVILHLLQAGRAWVKLSGGYIVSPLGTVEDPTLDALARSYLDTAPQRAVWGSDWPHATASAGQHALPDDARQLDRLAAWAGTPQQLNAVLLDNPQALYGFAPLSSHRPATTEEHS